MDSSEHVQGVPDFADAGGDFAGHGDATLDAERLQQLLLSTDTLRAFLDELVAAAAHDTDHECGITVRGVDGDPDYTVASSGELASRLDEQQYTDRTGPCLESLHTGRTVLVPDLSTETRWGPYPEQAMKIGARSSMSFPLLAGKASIGALNFYSTTPAPPESDVETRAAALAGRAAGALALALRLAERDDLIAKLRLTLTSRSTIDQALGILMAQQRCDDRTAFDLLRAASQARNVKLRDVAAQIVAAVNRAVPGAPPRGRY